MNTTNQKSTAPGGDKKEAYVSMDREERDILRTLGLRERALYPELKWLASFKTGQIQFFGKRVVTYQFLADLITVPTTQGRAADTMNPKEACRVLMKLHEAGLVGEIENDPVRGLRFALPMSPICKATARKLRLAEIAEAQKAQEKLPNEDVPKFDENPITTRPAGQSDLPLSVMTMFEEHQYDFHTDISNLASVHGTAADRDIAAVALLRAQIKAEVAQELPETNTDALSVETIKRRLRESVASFSWIDTKESEVMYQRWVRTGHAIAKFESAVAIVEEDFTIEPTPRAVDQVLRTGSSGQDDRLRQEQKRRRKGGVAL
jgi:hypothetical protein